MEENEERSTKIRKISPEKFYSNKVEPTWLQKLSQIRKPLPEINQDEEESNKGIYVEFPKQSAAFDYIPTALSLEPLVVFARETGCNVKSPNTEKGYNAESGKRSYIVTTYDTFWNRYCKLKPEDRTFYEMIRDGSPCHLYFDLEYQYEYNNDSYHGNNKDNEDNRGNRMVETLIEEVSIYLNELFIVKVKIDNVIDLESSSIDKFSRHLIIRIPGCCFESNIHCGNFVKRLINRLSKKRYESARVNELFVFNDKGKEVFFADIGVYTRNRNFRIYKSTKYGKDRYLVTSNKNKFIYKDDHDLFMKSLICNVKNGSRILTCTYIDDNQSIIIPSSNDTTPSKSIQPIDDSKTVMISEGYRTSKFPLIDKFIISAASSHGSVHAGFRSWIYYPDTNTIIYNIINSRYCENIGRHHKSNHIYFVVDIKKRTYHQRCYDPDCKGYQSNDYIIPSQCFLSTPLNVSQSSVSTTVSQSSSSYQLPPDDWIISDDDLLSIDI